MNGSLGEHGVVLKLGLAEGRGVGGDDDQLGLAGTEGLDGGLVAKGDWRQSLVACKDRKKKKAIDREHTLSGLHHKRKARVDGVTGLLALGGHRCAGRT